QHRSWALPTTASPRRACDRAVTARRQTLDLWPRSSTLAQVPTIQRPWEGIMTSDNDQISRFLARWAAAEQRGDVAALDGCLAEDFVGVGPLGFTLARPDWLARHRD